MADVKPIPDGYPRVSPSLAIAGASDANGGSLAAIAVGADGATRNITFTGTSDIDLLFEAAGLIDFTGLPVQQG